MESDVEQELRRAMDPYNAGDYREAHSRLDDMLERHPTNIEVLRSKGNLLEAEAFETASQKSGVPPSDPRLREAERCYMRILELNPQDTIALVDLGDQAEHRRQFDNAVSLAERALSLLNQGICVNNREQELVHAHSLRIRALLESGDHARAGDAKREALRAVPGAKEISLLC